MTAETVLGALGRMAAGPMPAELRAAMGDRVLDIAGIAVRATALDTSQAVAGFVLDQGGRPVSSAVGVPEKLPAAEAAFVNGVLAHSLDFDDTHLPSILHPSASVAPAALATAESIGASGAETLAAIAAGIEVCVRLGMGGFDPDARQSVFFERGQHATSICGAVGSAAASARARGAGAGGAAEAMAVACSMASGILETNRTGGTAKRLHCGWAARVGVVAADLAGRGLTGAPTAAEGRFGLLRAFLGDEARIDAVTDSLGHRWHAAEVFYKPYPANHFTHAGIDAALALRDRGLRPEEVASATLAVAPPTVRTIGEPIEAKRAPRTGYEAQFSGPYAVAAALCGGGGLGVGLDDFTDEAARRPQRRELMARIDVVGDPALLEIYPYQFPAVLTVDTVDGLRLVEERRTNRGGPERPLTTADLAAKFAANTDGLCPPARRDELAERIAALGAANDDGLAALMARLRRSGDPQMCAPPPKSLAAGAPGPGSSPAAGGPLPGSPVTGGPGPGP